MYPLENLKLAPTITGNLGDTDPHVISLGDPRYIKVVCLSTSANPITIRPPGDATGYDLAVGESTGIIPYTAQTLTLVCAGGDGDYVIWRWIP